MKTSWKTSVGGVITSIGLSLLGANAFDFIPKELGAKFMVIGWLLTIIGPSIQGLFARDNDVQSEDVPAIQKRTGNTVIITKPESK